MGAGKYQYYPVTDLYDETGKRVDADEAAVSRFWTLTGSPEDTYITMIVKQAEQEDYDAAYDKLSEGERDLYSQVSSSLNSDNLQEVFDAIIKDPSVDKAKRASIEKKLGLTGKGGTQKTFTYNQLTDFVPTIPGLQEAIDDMWTRHDESMDAIPKNRVDIKEEAPPKRKKKYSFLPSFSAKNKESAPNKTL